MKIKIRNYLVIISMLVLLAACGSGSGSGDSSSDDEMPNQLLTQPEPLVGLSNQQKTLDDDAFSVIASGGTGAGSFTYSSNNVDVASVNVNTGEVNIVGSGKAIISVIKAADDNYKAKKASYTLSVAFKNHQTAFSQLDANKEVIIESEYNNPRISYGDNYNFGKYVGYVDLLNKYQRYLPTGKKVTVLQAENAHTPETIPVFSSPFDGSYVDVSIGIISHLFNPRGIQDNKHSTTIARILTIATTYPTLYTQYSTLSPKLDLFHTATTRDLSRYLSDVVDNNYPLFDYNNQAITPAKILNISNTNGGSSVGPIREFDKFVEQNDLLATTAQNGGSHDNVTTSGNSYNSLVVDQVDTRPINDSGAQINDHGNPRYKPDIITFSNPAGASSYAAPTIASAAAMLLERINVDPDLSNAFHSVVLKAIILAGATRYNYKISTEWASTTYSDATKALFNRGEWQRSSDSQPTDPKYGVGVMNILASYNILEGGEFNANITTSTTTFAQGWDYHQDVIVNNDYEYYIHLASPSVFSAVLTWHRKIDNSLVSHLADYQITLYDNNNKQIAKSDNTTSNIELIEASLTLGAYKLVVNAKSSGGFAAMMPYGLAWISKKILPKPSTVSINTIAGTTTLVWNMATLNTDDYKYRLQISDTTDFSDIVHDLYLDRPQYSLPANSSHTFKVFAYPKDSEVAYFYPSAGIMLK